MTPQARAVETRAVIIRAAADVFGAFGYGGASMADICLAAGLTKGAVYFHFESKEALALAVIDAQHERAIALGGELLHSDQPGLHVLVRMAVELATQLRTDPVSRAGIRLTMESSNLSAPVVTPYEDWIAACDLLLRRAILDGDVRADVDVAAAARFISPAFTGVQVVSDVLTGRDDLMQRIVEMWSFVLPSLVVPERWEQLRTLPQEIVELWA
ncbi:ScbR family autoregulator-binding transcription factor [Cryobacterium sp.]|jgi:AcrR family transcriptional regulator|uniref:ScbR family autoregulator-binding transcription factor n=1 Tax=Cryobacterium sp. TaxID=1926290 RepID=UPI00262E5B93|nr:ScbR family autoregulator-binding transcription factor [Cryobacterium sp.]MCU1445505.1 TetR family transcriptional regulator [Cryobacterium sp.]